MKDYTMWKNYTAFNIKPGGTYSIYWALDSWE